jgi:hypothetical protein
MRGPRTLGRSAPRCTGHQNQTQLFMQHGAPPNAPVIHQPPSSVLPGAPASSSDDDCWDQGGGASAGAAPYPSELLVVAKSNAGVYMVDRCAVRCACAACAPLGPSHLVSPTEFERHSGIPAAKKWRFRCGHRLAIPARRLCDGGANDGAARRPRDHEHTKARWHVCWRAGSQLRHSHARGHSWPLACPAPLVALA